MVWSSYGDIAAGKGAKTSISPKFYDYTLDPVVNMGREPAGLPTGAGIGTVASQPGAPEADVDLVAPNGIVDAGDAGIRVSGNFNVFAVQILGTDNIDVQGVSTGLPVPPAAPPTSLNVDDAAAKGTRVIGALLDDALKAGAGERRDQGAVDHRGEGAGLRRGVRRGPRGSRSATTRGQGERKNSERTERIEKLEHECSDDPAPGHRRRRSAPVLSQARAARPRAARAGGAEAIAPTFGFARGTNAIALTGAEFAPAARRIPSCSRRPRPVVPFAVVGMRDSENLFLDAQGRLARGLVHSRVRAALSVHLLRGRGLDRGSCCVSTRRAENFEAESAQPFFDDGKPGEGVHARAEVQRDLSGAVRRHAAASATGSTRTDCWRRAWRAPSSMAAGSSRCAASARESRASCAR